MQRKALTAFCVLPSGYRSLCLRASVAIAVLVLVAVCVVAPTLVKAQGTTRYVYDDNGRLRAVVSPTGEAAVYEYDAAGNFTAIRRLRTDDLEILDFFPREGVAGDLVTFIGVGFGTGATAVAFNGASAEIVETSSTVVVARVPEAATTGPVAITVPRGTVMTPAPFVVRGVRVSPASVTTVSGESVQFTAAVTLEGDRSVRWSVNSVDGGSSAVGTISATGLYVAPNLPASVPTLTFIIRATSVAVPAVFGEARATVRNPEFISTATAPFVSVRRGSLTGASAITREAISVGYGSLPGGSISRAALAPFLSVQRGSLTGVFAITRDPISVRYGSPPGIGSTSSPLVSATTGPYILSISPDRMTRGAATAITITGVGLNGTTSLRFIDDNGAIDSSISVSNLTVAPDGTSLTATLTVGGSSALGRRIVVVLTPTSRSLTFITGSNTIEIVAP